MKHAGVGLSIIVALGMTVAAAEATVGDVLATVAIPAGALCAGNSGTAVAVVPGGKVLFPQIPVLLVTSCQDKLFFLNPATSPATLVKTLTTSINPSGGWKALTFRADRGDLLACQQVSATQTAALYSIDFIPAPLNTVADGLATLVRNGPTGATCAGIAWDSSDKTIYQTGLNASNVNVVFHFGESQASALPAISASCLGATDSLTGVAVAGTSLFVSCFTPSSIGDEIRQGYKVNGALTRDINVSTPGSLAYDPVSVGSQYKDLIWTKDPAQLRAVEIPGGTSGQVRGAPVLFPAACPAGYATGNADTDNDGLLGCWKDGTLWSDGLPGISFNGNWNGNIANRDVTLCVETNGTPGFQVPPVVPELLSECARPGRKDVFVEIDYMQFHRPDPVAINNVVTAFLNAPSPDATHPTYPGPIRLHVQINEEIPHNNATALLPCTPAPAVGDANFDTLKTQWFGTDNTERGVDNRINAKSFSFHYALFVHNQSGTGNTASGCAEVGGNDLMVSLGSWGLVTQIDGTTHAAGTTDQQSGTFMHELGHNLGLRHGGDVNTNCKPNYQSVMNYALQTSNLLTGRPLDFSRQALATLNEASLDETKGVGAGLPLNQLILMNGKVVFGPQAGIPSKALQVTVAADGSIDWSRNGSLSTVPRDLNNLSIAGCPALTGTFPGNAETLTGFNDWANINLNFRASLDFAGGATSSIDENNPTSGTRELTLDEALALSRDVIDIKPADKKNTIKRSDSPTINVAIFSRRDDQGLLEFDARDLDPATIFLRGTGGATWALPVVKTSSGFHCKQQDVDKDGLLDLVCQFKLGANTLSLTETKAILEGTTFTGSYDFHSSDAIRVVP